MPRALILYTDRPTTEDYFNFVGRLADSSKNHVYWASGWYQKQTYVVNFPAPLTEARTVRVQAALVDNDQDTRPLKLNIAAMNGTTVSKTFSPTNPTAGQMLNIITTTINAPVGTNRLVFTLESPRNTGDSGALVGVTANYICVQP
jgi:hypothetical protein